MSEPGYLRQPALHGDTIAFVCDDDLWSVAAGGGIARRLTAGLGEPSTPHFSHDGKWLAFIGRDEQHPEVYLMPAEGGSARRMTWLGPDVIVRGWTPEGQILFVTTHGQPFFRNYRAFTLPVEGGLPTPLALGQVNHLAFGAGNARVIGRNTADPARWKRYRGGTAGHLWIDAGGSGTFRRMSELEGNITSPMLISERVWFLSDAEGVGNLYSCNHDGSGLRRHTDHDDFYARNATTDGRRIVYGCGAEIWLFDPATDTTQRVPIDVPAHRTQSARKFSAVESHLAGFNVHPAGHSLAIEARGKLFAFALWEGAVRQHGVADGVRYRHGQWLHDGKTLIAVSDEQGDERLQVFGPDGQTRTLPWDIGRVQSMKASPRQNRIAICNHRNEVIVGDLDSNEMTVADKSEAARTEDLAWSPDGEWLAYNFWTTGRHCAIKLYEVSAGTSTLVTEPNFRDWSPAFDPDGRYLYFLSIRTFDPVYDAVQFELSFPRAARPYLIALREDVPPPFDPKPRGVRGEGERIKDVIHEKPEPRKIGVDLEDIARRVAPFPVREERYGQIAGASNDKVLWSVLPILGAHGRGGHKEGPGKLEIFDFQTLKTEPMLERVDQFVVADDHATVVIRDGKKLRALPAEKPSDERALKADTPSRQSGWIDLNRVRISVSPKKEWRQMLREAWRLQRDQFWVPDMSGIDWDAVRARYEPLLERVSTRSELSDLIWEMHGELGTSHAYEMGGDHRKPPEVALGLLAADLAPWPHSGGAAGTREGYAIDHIVAGDPWDTGADSPLNAVGVRAKSGDHIVAVNGQPVTRENPPQSLLVHQAGNKVALTLSRDGKSREVVITALADEVPARYREWVERNREFVHSRSKNRVGYLHLPDMQSSGFAEFHRYFSVECDRDSMIVDVRYNRGGHVSQLLLEKVARKRIGYDLQRWGQPQPYPIESPAGPVVGLTNEHSGSDGDIFSHCFKLMKLGPLVGTRTWGGVIGIWPRHQLVDGSETTQPEFSFWFNDVGWQVENYGTDPEIEIDNAPQDAAAGHDRQLETAIEVALGLLAERGATGDPFGPKPVLARKPLPPRKRT